MDQPLIQFKDVHKHFGDKRVLDGIDLSIYAGQITSIIGKSGVGKSVLLKHMIGLIQQDSGDILFNGKPLVLSLLYTSCYHICPMTTRHLSKVVEKARAIFALPP